MLLDGAQPASEWRVGLVVGCVPGAQSIGATARSVLLILFGRCGITPGRSGQAKTSERMRLTSTWSQAKTPAITGPTR
jgi:hypothetical protein